jgi:hypothetical protein
MLGPRFILVARDGRATEVNETTDKNRTPKAAQVRPMLKYELNGHYWYVRAPGGYVLRKIVAPWDLNEPHTVVNFELVPSDEVNE